MQAARRVPPAEEDPGVQGLGLQEVLRGLERRVTLTPHERALRPKSGGPCWQSLVQFYAIDCAKAGWLVRREPNWFLTPEGRQALALDPLTAYSDGFSQGSWTCPTCCASGTSTQTSCGTRAGGACR